MTAVSLSSKLAMCKDLSIKMVTADSGVNGLKEEHLNTFSYRVSMQRNIM